MSIKINPIRAFDVLIKSFFCDVRFHKSIIPLASILANSLDTRKEQEFCS